MKRVRHVLLTGLVGLALVLSGDRAFVQGGEKMHKWFFKAFVGGGMVFILLFLFVSHSAAQDCIAPPDGLVSWWDADSVSGNTAFDIKDGNDGLLLNGATIAPGEVGQAFSLDGSDDYLEVPDADNLDLTTRGTLAVWVYVRSLANIEHKIVIAKGPWSRYPGLNEGGTYGLSISPQGTVYLYTAGPCYGCASSITAGVVPLNTWTHLAGTWDGSQMKAYVNGISVGTAPQIYLPVPGNNDSLRIGITREFGLPGEEHFDGRFFDGLIDEVQIYNRSLSDNEIASIYGAGSAGICKVISVAIDIKPGSTPNCFNNNDHGVIPVAVLSSVDFDATQVDPSTVSLDGQGVRVVGKGNTQAHNEDVNNDGLVDLVVQIEDVDGTYAEGNATATLMGETFDGTPVEGTDSICIVP